MNTPLKVAIAMAVAAYLWPRAAEPVSVVLPSASLQAAVQPIAAILKGSPDDARRLAAFYNQFAEVVGRDASVIATTEQLRTGHVAAGRLAFPELRGKYPGLADAINRIFADQVGLENAALTPEKRSKAVEVLKAICWGCAHDR